MENPRTKWRYKPRKIIHLPFENGKPSISIRAIYTMVMLNSQMVLVQWRIFQLATGAPRNLRAPRRASLLKDLHGAASIFPR